MAYVLNATVTAAIQNAYSTSVLTSANIDSFIAIGDGIINGALANRYMVPFNAIGGTPATPEAIQAASMSYALFECYRKLGLVNTQGQHIDRSNAEREKFDALLAMLEDGTYQIDPESKTGETLTWGTDATAYTLSTDESYFATGVMSNGFPPNVLPDTVYITGGTGITSPTALQLGTDFSVRFDTGWRKWVLTDLSGYLKSVSDVTISYQWSYERMTGNTSEAGIEGYVLG